MNEILDIFGQQPFFTINTQLAFFFPFKPTNASPETTRAASIEVLTSGLERLYSGFPWLACQVMSEGSGPENTGTYRFKPMDPAPGIVVKDYTHDASIPTMEDLGNEKFPMRMLPEEVFAPRATFAGPGTEEEPAPAFLVQASFLQGGIVLCFVAQHNTMDMTGKGFIMRMFDKACRGEPFTHDELEKGNLPRRDIVPLLDESWTPGPEMEHHIVDPNEKRRDHGSERPRFVSSYFAFSAAALAALKKRAEEVVRPPAFVSTDDAVTAFIWQSILRARLPRIAAGRTSTISRAINLRPALGIPSMYPGPIQDSVYSTFTATSLVDSPLGTIASALRSALDPRAVAFQARASATFLSRTPNKNLYSSTADFDLGVDFILSSWASVKAYSFDFGLRLGRPEAVRKPQFEAVEGLCFLMPKTVEGGVAAAMCLRGEDLERLRADAEFVELAEYIG